MKKCLSIFLLIILFVNFTIINTVFAQSDDNLEYIFTTIDGKSISTRAEGGKCKVLIFGSTTCLNCKQTISSLAKNSIIKSDKVEFAFLESSGATLEETKEFAELYGNEDIVFAYGASNAMWSYIMRYDFEATPLILFVDENNRIRKTLSGRHFSNEIVNELESFAGIINSECISYSGNNYEKQNYDIHSSVINSYLQVCNDNTFMRVQYDSKNEGNILVEYYDNEYNLLRARYIAEELPIFGGFFATEEFYFTVTGQENIEESNTKEVYRITKYDLNWNKIESVGLSNCNTTIPFKSGSCRIDASGKYLLIRTSHQMYTSSDGLKHQANLTMEINMETMTITDSYTVIMNSDYGYISHSFNQFIKVENNKIIAVDHGDAYPRSIVLIKYSTDVSKGIFAPGYYTPCETIDVMTLNGTIGQNKTGASVGGFEISASNYLIAGNSVLQDDNNLIRSTRNVFIASVNKTTSKVNINWITSFDEGDGTTSTPQLVKINENRFVVLWSREDMVYYTQIDASGKQIGSIFKFTGELSDCKPIISNKKIIWYSWNNRIINFYSIDTDNLEKYNAIERTIGHNYEILGINDDIANLKCTICGNEKKESIITSMRIYWNTHGGHGYYSSLINYEQRIGNTLYCWVQPVNNADDNEIEIISSDNTVARVFHLDKEMYGIDENDTLKRIEVIGPGETEIIIRPKYNPQLYKRYYINVTRDLEVEALTTDYINSAPFGNMVMLGVYAKGGYGTLQYKFYEKLSDGTINLIRDYDANDICQWKPSIAGKRTLYVDVKDEQGTVETKSIDGFVINKAEAVTYGDIIKKHYYATGENSNIVNIASLLPSDRGTSSYSKVVTDAKGILNNVSVSSAGILTYDVKNTGTIGDTATITVNTASENYENATVKIQIKLIDKKTVFPKSGSEPKINGSNQLTYGQKLSTLALNQSQAVFVAESGETVAGTLTFNKPDLIPTVKATTATWTFTPNSAAYKTCSGSVNISVKKATPELKDATANQSTYIPNMKLKDIALNAGTATATVAVAGTEMVIEGIWEWKNVDQSIQAGTKKYAVVFTPTDSVNYNTAEMNVEATVTKATPVVDTLPTASEITYSQSLGNSTLTGGTAKVGETIIPGVYQWNNTSAKPTVSDSQKTQYELTFKPSDSTNYNSVLCKVMLTVNPIEKAPNMPQNEMNVAFSTTTVNQIKLPEGWRWKNEDLDKELIVEIPLKATAVYKDTVNYKISSVEISITRSQCDHVESGYIVDIKPTCTTTGIAHTECTICHDTLRTNILLDMIEHSWDLGVITKAATTTEQGERLFTCTACGETKTEIIEKLPKKDSSSGGTCTSQSVVRNTTAVQNGITYKVTKAGKSNQAEITIVGIDKTKKSVTIPDTVTIGGVKCKVTAIGAKAFANSKKLKKVVIGKNVRSIEKKAFYNCKKLKTIKVKSKVLKKVGKKAIKGIHKKAIIKVPKKKLKAYNKLFKKKTGFVKPMRIKK